MKRHGEIKIDGKTIGEICSRCQKIEYYEEEWEGTSKLAVFHLSDYYSENPSNPPILTIDGDHIHMCSPCIRELAPQFMAAQCKVVLDNI